MRHLYLPLFALALILICAATGHAQPNAPLRFEPGSTDLAASAKAPLRSIAEYLRSLAYQSIHVVGHGNDLELGTLRAEAVVEALETQGLSGDGFTVSGTTDPAPGLSQIAFFVTLAASPATSPDDADANRGTSGRGEPEGGNADAADPMTIKLYATNQVGQLQVQYNSRKKNGSLGQRCSTYLCYKPRWKPEFICDYAGFNTGKVEGTRNLDDLQCKKYKVSAFYMTTIAGQCLTQWYFRYASKVAKPKC